MAHTKITLFGGRIYLWAALWKASVCFRRGHKFTRYEARWEKGRPGLSRQKWEGQPVLATESQ